MGRAPDTEGEDIMAHLLLIDDDPALIPKLVRQVFPGPAHRVEDLKDDVCGAHAEGRVEISPRERVVQVAKSPLVLMCHDRSP